MAYTPASVLTSGSLPQLNAIKYEREAIPNLKANTPFMSCTKQKPLAVRQGNQVQFFTYALLGANTNQASEGAVGSPITESTTKIIATVGQYADFINCSDIAVDVSIEDPGLLQNLATELNYRLALTLNSLTQLTADASVAIDSNVNIQLANGSYLTANNIRSAVQSLLAANVRPVAAGGFLGIMHPNVVKDVLNDSSFNGLTDILKRGSDADRAKLMVVPGNDDVIEFAGGKFKQTTTAPSTTIGGNTYFNTYLFGEDALFSIFLGPNSAGEKNYKLFIQNAPESGSVSDPARQIGGWCSYNTKFTNTLPPGSVQRLRRLQSETSAS